jgi:hypothetical protein
MTYEIYRYIFIGAAIAAGVMLAVTLILFFVLKIPGVIGDLSGRTARKAIADIRNHNMSANTDNIGSGKLTDKITASGRLMERRDSSGNKYTDKISTEKLIEQNKLSGSNETTLLNDGNETTVLNTGNETTVLNAGNETTVLDSYSSGQTVILNSDTAGFKDIQSAGYVNVESDITFIHSAEIID